MRSLMAAIFEKGAGWFVSLAWLLVILAILANIFGRIGAGISLTYHPLHETAPYERELINVLDISSAVAVLVAISSSVALARRRRFTASLMVIGSWPALIAYSQVDLAFVEKGPQFFERYAGDTHFRIPWQYGPKGEDRPTQNGVSLNLCLATLAGQYVEACMHGELTQVSIYPADSSFIGGHDEASWRRDRAYFVEAGVENGHQAYAKTLRREGDRAEPQASYFRRTDPNGILLRAVACYGHDSCEHFARLDRYMLYYTTSKADFAKWEEIDRKLTSLVDSWIVP